MHAPRKGFERGRKHEIVLPAAVGTTSRHVTLCELISYYTKIRLHLLFSPLLTLENNKDGREKMLREICLKVDLPIESTLYTCSCKGHGDILTGS